MLWIFCFFSEKNADAADTLVKFDIIPSHLDITNVSINISFPNLNL